MLFDRKKIHLCIQNLFIDSFILLNLFNFCISALLILLYVFSLPFSFDSQQMEFVQLVVTLLGLRLSRSDDAVGDLIGYLLFACAVLLWCYALFLAIKDLVDAYRRDGKLSIARALLLILCFGAIGIGVAAQHFFPKDVVGEFWGLVIQVLQIVLPLCVCLTYMGRTCA